MFLLLTSAAPVGSDRNRSGTSSDHSGTSSNPSSVIPYPLDTRLDTLEPLGEPLRYEFSKLFKDLRLEHYCARRIMWHHCFEYEERKKKRATDEANEEHTKCEEAYQKVEGLRKRVFAEADRLLEAITTEHRAEFNREKRRELGDRKTTIEWQRDYYRSQEKNPFAENA